MDKRSEQSLTVVTMGAIAEALVAYIRPLLDQTDGSQEQMNKAMAIGQLCYNLALLPKDEQERSIGELQTSLTMDDDEFADFRLSVIDPMIRRHQEMFPRMSESFPLERGGPPREVPRNRSLRPVSLQQRPKVQVLLRSKEPLNFWRFQTLGKAGTAMVPDGCLRDINWIRSRDDRSNRWRESQPALERRSPENDESRRD